MFQWFHWRLTTQRCNDNSLTISETKHWSTASSFFSFSSSLQSYFSSLSSHEWKKVTQEQKSCLSGSQRKSALLLLASQPQFMQLSAIRNLPSFLASALWCQPLFALFWPTSLICLKQMLLREMSLSKHNALCFSSLLTSRRSNFCRICWRGNCFRSVFQFATWWQGIDTERIMYMLRA